jgi:hypothetical protein
MAEKTCCDSCGTTEKELSESCSHCGQEVYCSVTCKELDWAGHQLECNVIQNVGSPLDAGFIPYAWLVSPPLLKKTTYAPKKAGYHIPSLAR